MPNLWKTSRTFVYIKARVYETRCIDAAHKMTHPRAVYTLLLSCCLCKSSCLHCRIMSCRVYIQSLGENIKHLKCGHIFKNIEKYNQFLYSVYSSKDACGNDNCFFVFLNNVNLQVEKQL